MTDYLYDVALSFAGTERDYVREVAAELKRAERRVFFDEDEQVSLWGENLIEVLDAIYRHQARFVVMFVSQGYAASAWTRVERRSALTRAMTERRAYVLPARFDDTDLPGLLPSLHYISLRGVSPADLAGRIVAKLTDTEPQSLAGSENEAGWEYLLFADTLDEGLKSLGDARSDQRIGFAAPTGQRIATLDELPGLLRAFIDEVPMWMSSIEDILTDENQKAAFGAAGHPGDAAAIRHLASALTRVYGGLIDWAQRVRGTAVPAEASGVMRALSRLAEPAIDQYEAFVMDYGARARKAIHQLQAGLPIDEPEIDITLRFHIPDEIQAEWDTTLSRFKRETRRRR